MAVARRWLVGLVAVVVALLPQAAWAGPESPDHPGAIAGLVVDQAGDPVGGAFVVLHRPGSPFLRATKTGPMGHFGYKPVPVGPWIVSAAKKDVGFGFAKVLVEPEKVSKVEIELKM